MNWRRWMLALHRDLGYFFTGVVVLYAISGITVNHADDWNPDFVIERSDIALELPSDASQVTAQGIRTSLDSIGESQHYRSFDVVSSQKIKIYLADGDMVVGLIDGRGTREKVRPRPVLHAANVLHLNPKKWWRLFSDIFAASLIFIAVTGLIIVRGRRGLFGRGKWLVGAGLIAPLVAMFVL